VAVADPAKLITSGELGALLAIETLPLAPPAEVGVYFTVKDVWCPAAIVTGADNPLIENPLPDGVAWEIVTLPLPEFVKVMDWLPLLPTLTDPKLTDAGLAPS